MRRTAHPWRRFSLIAGVLAVVLLGGCGGGSSGPAKVADTDRLAVAEFNSNVTFTILGTSRAYGDLLDTIDPAIAIARKNPDALYETEGSTDTTVGTYPAESRTMRQVLSDAAAKLAPYEPNLAAKLDRAVETLPAP